MDVRVTSDAQAFEDTTFGFLQQDPVLHTVVMSNVHERATGLLPLEDGTAYYVSVHDPDVVGVAMRVPGRKVYVGALREELADAVADAYVDVLPEAPGVGGVRPAAERFARRWCERRGGQFVEAEAARLHKLVELTPLAADGGAARPVREDDLELVAAWAGDGFEELKRERDWARRQLEHGTLWMWEVGGEPVSMVGFHLPIFGVCRVGPVYTPPEHRKHGYAGALTSQVSAQILADGNEACLYTDLANPTSNKIYYQAGYRPVADFVELDFVA
ncbi:GNAT family N-acetyltransferase [Kribbella sp. NPDC026611]|uniref:GNAT family N-acetyltransferase n=1 Tax=Kribbella sp. NPDC026611 TaxID=3154911 RepID=UPI0033E752F6